MTRNLYLVPRLSYPTKNFVVNSYENLPNRVQTSGSKCGTGTRIVYTSESRATKTGHLLAIRTTILLSARIAGLQAFGREAVSSSGM